MDFFFLILLTATMLLRPEELVTDLTGARFYYWFIIITTITAIPKLSALFTLAEIQRRPIVACVFGFAVALLISSMRSHHWDEGEMYCEEFAKVLLYFLLLHAILDTPERLHQFLGWLVVMVCGVATITALHYYEVFEFPGLQPTIVELRMNKETGEAEEIKRAVASGIFGDPNDLCLILSLGMICCFYHAFATGAGSARIFWLLPVVPLFFVLSLTGSRGGMLGLLAGFAAIVYSYYGLKAGIPMMVLGFVGLLAAAGGRAADIAGGGTARERLNLWGEGLTSLLRHPFEIPFGLGPGWYIRDQGLLAHNSFINAYVEMGVFGGGFFLIAFMIAAWLINYPNPETPLPMWARTMRPAMLALVVAYAAGCFSLSRHLVLPTYLVLGLASVYISLVGDPPAAHRVTNIWFRWALLAMVLGLVLMKVLTVVLGSRI